MIIDEIKNYKAGSPQRKIGEYLMLREDIQENLQKKNKSLAGCISYIIQKAKKQAENNCAFMTDEEVFGLAVHYYDKDELKDFDENRKVEERCEIKTGQENIKTRIEKKAAEEKYRKKKKISDNQISMFDFIGDGN